jgi:hypothetical protein
MAVFRLIICQRKEGSAEKNNPLVKKKGRKIWLYFSPFIIFHYKTRESRLISICVIHIVCPQVCGLFSHLITGNIMAEKLTKSQRDKLAAFETFFNMLEAKYGVSRQEILDVVAEHGLVKARIETYFEVNHHLKRKNQK